MLIFSKVYPYKKNQLGTIHISRKQRGWLGGVGKMLTFAYMVDGLVGQGKCLHKQNIGNNWNFCYFRRGLSYHVSQIYIFAKILG